MSSFSTPTPCRLWFSFARLLALLGFFTLVFGAVLSAQSTINIKFGNNVYTGAGVTGSGTFWNYFSGSSGSSLPVLANSDGETSGVSLAVTYGSRFGGNVGLGSTPDKLLGSGLYGPFSFRLSGLDPASSYTLCVFLHDKAGHATTMAMAGLLTTAQTPADSIIGDRFTEGGNYLKFTGVRPSVLGEITGFSSVSWGGLNGLQVQAVPIAPGLADVGPAFRVVAPGERLSLSVNATGTGPLVYQWFRNGQALPGATEAAYAGGETPRGHSAAYWVEVTNAVGTVRSPVWFVRCAVHGAPVAVWGGAPSNVSTIPVGIVDPVAVAARTAHVLALQANGTVVAWGSNGSGQCNVPTGLVDAVAVAAGGGHSLALRSNGSVLAWGENLYGQASVPAGLEGVIAISSGLYHSLALKSDGTVVAWGWNNWGQSTVPDGLSSVVGIAAGYYHSLALKADGTVVAWGLNYSGQCNVPADLTGVFALAGGSEHSLALRSNGTVISWGSTSFAPPSSGVGSVVALGAGASQSIALKADGTLVAWGWGSTTPSAIPPSANFTLAVSNNFAVALRDPAGDQAPTIGAQPQNWTGHEGATATLSVSATAGTAPVYFQWRRNGVALSRETGPTLILPAIQSAQAGTYSVLVYNHLGSLVSDSVLVALDAARPVITAFVPPHVVMPLGQPLSLAVRARAPGLEPILYQWYQNGRPITGATAPTYAPGMATLADSGIYWVKVTNSVGSNLSALVRVSCAPATTVISRLGAQFTNVSPGLVRPVLVSTGQYASFALCADGQVFDASTGVVSAALSTGKIVSLTVGGSHSLSLKSDGGVLRTGTAGPPPFRDGLGDVWMIEAGRDHSLALKRNGQVVAWDGKNDYGQNNVPAGLSGVVGIAAGAYHSLALKADGTVVGWGYNYYGQVNVPAGLSDVVAIAAGAYFSLALKADGSVVHWGLRNEGLNVPPAGLSEVVALDAGDSHSLALKHDGTVVAWGTNKSGQVTVPATVPAGLGGVFAISAGSDKSFVVRGAVPSLSAFQSRHFTPAQIAEPTVSNAAADPDQDGLPNLMEYAFDLDPTSPNSMADASRPVVTLERFLVGTAKNLMAPSERAADDSPKYLTISYVKNIDATEVIYKVEVSSDLITWESRTLGDDTPATVIVSTTPLDATHTRVVERDTSTSSPDKPRFIRLVISMTTPPPPGTGL